MRSTHYQALVVEGEPAAAGREPVLARRKLELGVEGLIDSGPERVGVKPAGGDAVVVGNDAREAGIGRGDARRQ